MFFRDRQRPIQSLARQGAITMETVLLLSTIVVVLVAGSYSLSGKISGFYGQAASELIAVPTSQKRVSATSTLSESHRTSATPRDPITPVANTSTTVFCLIMLGATLMLALVITRTATRRSNTARSKPPPQPRDIFAQRQRILRAFSNDSGLFISKKLSVGHAVNSDVSMVSPSDSSEKISQLFHSTQCEHIFVCDQERNLLGVIPREQFSSSQGQCAKHFMQDCDATLSPDTRLNAAITQMLGQPDMPIPVVKSGKLIGDISHLDLAITLQCTLQVFERIASFVRNQDNLFEVDANPNLKAKLANHRELIQSLQIRLEKEQISKHLIDPLSALATEGAGLVGEMERKQATLDEQISNMMSLFEPQMDPLTSLPNRRAFDDSLESLLSIMKRHQQQASMLIIKLISNDATSDESLVKLADEAKQLVRDSDYLACYEYGTLAILLNNTNPDDAKEAQDRMQDRFNAVFDTDTGAVHTQLFHLSADEPMQTWNDRISNHPIG